MPILKTLGNGDVYVLHSNIACVIKVYLLAQAAFSKKMPRREGLTCLPMSGSRTGVKKNFF